MADVAYVEHPMGAVRIEKATDVARATHLRPPAVAGAGPRRLGRPGRAGGRAHLAGERAVDLTGAEWDAFTAGVRAGEFDRPTP